MADLHSNSKENSSLTMYILLSVILLSVLYLLAKGCTNRSGHETKAHHTTGEHAYYMKNSAGALIRA